MVELAELHQYAGKHVRVRLADDTIHVGRLRTELLTDLSISVYLAGDHGDGATIYIEDIVAIS